MPLYNPYLRKSCFKEEQIELIRGIQYCSCSTSKYIGNENVIVCIIILFVFRTHRDTEISSSYRSHYYSLI